MLAPELNVSQLRESWLLSNGVLDASDKLDNLVIAPVAVSFRTEFFEFLALGDRVQVGSVGGIAPEENNRYFAIAKALVNALPDGTFKAIGLNFEFRIPLFNTTDLADRYRDKVLSKNFALASDFSTADVRAGFYISRQFDEGRLRLESKPIVDSENRELLQIAANFNLNTISKTASIAWLDKAVNAFTFAKTLSDKLEVSFNS